MYAIVRYNDYRKEQFFEIIKTTEDLEYAKKLAFQQAKKNLTTMQKYDTKTIYKLTTEYNDEYLRPINKKIISYRTIGLEKCKRGYKILFNSSRVYTVLDILSTNTKEDLEEIDNSLLCNKYVDYNYEEEEEDN